MKAYASLQKEKKKEKKKRKEKNTPYIAQTGNKIGC